MRNREQVMDAFVPKEKMGPGQKMAILKMQNSVIECATDALLDVPDCPMRTIGLNKLLEAKQCFSHAISHPDNHLLGVGPSVGAKDAKAKNPA